MQAELKEGSIGNGSGIGIVIWHRVNISKKNPCQPNRHNFPQMNISELHAKLILLG